MAVAEVCQCKTPMVSLGVLKNGKEVWACPKCDAPDKPVDKDSKNIIQLSEENHE